MRTSLIHNPVVKVLVRMTRAAGFDCSYDPTGTAVNSGARPCDVHINANIAPYNSVIQNHAAVGIDAVLPHPGLLTYLRKRSHETAGVAAAESAKIKERGFAKLQVPSTVLLPAAIEVFGTTTVTVATLLHRLAYLIVERQSGSADKEKRKTAIKRAQRIWTTRISLTLALGTAKFVLAHEAGRSNADADDTLDFERLERACAGNMAGMPQADGRAEAD